MMHPALTNLTPEEISRLLDRNGTECCLPWAEWSEIQVDRAP